LVSGFVPFGASACATLPRRTLAKHIAKAREREHSIMALEACIRRRKDQVGLVVTFV
jgi:hypothetical protein